VPSQLPQPASKLYAQNIVNLVTLMTRDGAFAPDFEDEIVRGSCVTREGRIVHEPTREAIEGPRDPEPASDATLDPTLVVEPVDPDRPVEDNPEGGDR
jgi:NAD(P) transhydrogenase subunit alpha